MQDSLSVDALHPTERHIFQKIQHDIIRTIKIWDQLPREEYTNEYNYVYLHPTTRRIQYLSIWGNNLSEIPSSIGELLELRILDLSSNHLTSLPNSFEKLIHLEKIDLSTNLFAISPAILQQLPELKEVRLQHNMLTAIPWQFARFNGNFQITENFNNPNEHIFFDGESGEIWDWAKEGYMETNPQTFSQYVIQRIRRILCQLYPTRMELVLFKIKNCEPIDQLDWTHPDFCQWRSVVELTMHQFHTSVADTYIQKFDQLCKVRMPQRSILL